MLIVPVRGDKVRIDGWAEEQVVSSYSSLKKGGAIYVEKPLDPDFPFAALSSILTVNGVAVVQKSNGMLSTKGLVKRKVSLPQPGDTIEVLIAKNSLGVDEKASYTVTDIEVTDNPSFPIKIKSDKSSFSLSEITNVKRKVGYESFDLRAFRRLYVDYLPIGNPKEE